MNPDAAALARTPGEWVALHINDDEWGVCTYADRLEPGQTVLGLLVVALGLTEAEARLMASAPALRAALERIIEYADDLVDSLPEEAESRPLLNMATAIQAAAHIALAGEAPR